MRRLFPSVLRLRPHPVPGCRPPAANPLLWVALVVALLQPGPSLGDALRVRVVEGRTGLPLNGAFVQVGPAPGAPFAHNWGWTAADGTILFSDPLLIGPQTVTAGYGGMSLCTVIRSAVDSIRISLHPEIMETTLPEPKAEVGGSVSGIDVRNNDGNLDVGIVYPTVQLADILARRSVPFEAPPDTLTLPLIGPVVLPGNVVIPTQIEAFILVFSKPNYHLFVPDNRNYDFLVLAGRLPLTSLGGSDLPLNQITMREIGAERAIPVHGDRALNLNSDLNLSHDLTVQMPEAPSGTDVLAAALGDLPIGGSPRSLFFDLKTALRDTLTAFHMSGMNPAGDMADARPYLAGFYSDSSNEKAFQAGRVDRTPLTLPATRTLGQFFLIPSLEQIGYQFRWSDVARPGITPDPTWAVGTFRLAPMPGDSTVTSRAAWEIWAPAEDLGLELPVLAPGAPSGLPDPSETPEADRLLWDCLLADPAGPIDQVMEDPFSSLTRWSERTIEVNSPASAVEEVALGMPSGRSLRFRLTPNPGQSSRDIYWDQPLPTGQPVAWTVLDPAGRRRASGSFAASGSLREARALQGIERLPTGVYWVQLRVGNRHGSLPMIVAR